MIIPVHLFERNPTEPVPLWANSDASSTTAKVHAKFSAGGKYCRIIIATNEANLLNGSAGQSFAPIAVDQSLGIGKFDLTGLTPNTFYYYTFENFGKRHLVAADIGRFKTMPTTGTSLKIGWGSCLQNSSNHVILDKVTAQDLHKFYFLGDLGYGDLNSGTDSLYYNQFDLMMAQSKVRSFFLRNATRYIPSDHDSSTNNGNAVANATAMATFKRIHRQVKASLNISATVTDSLYQSEQIGDIRVLLMDVRTERDAQGDADDSNKDLMQTTQLNAWKADVDAAAAAGDKALIHLGDMNIMGAASAGQDDWRGYTVHRTKVMDYLVSKSVDVKSVYGCGDGHWYLLDKGNTNTKFGTGATGQFLAVMEASPMDQFRVAFPGLANTDGGGDTGTAGSPYDGLYVIMISNITAGHTASLDFKLQKVTSGGTESTLDSMLAVAVP